MSPAACTAPTISIIVPIYNVEPYLRLCVDSILTQTFRDFELLLIDDGSPDKCGDICDEYERADKRVRVFHRENGGLSAARNTGLDNMVGAYVTMVDPDDVLISRNYLRALHDALIRHDAELSLCRHVLFENGAAVPCENGDTHDVFVCSGEEYVLWRNMPTGFLPHHAHGKLYAARLFDGIRYPEGRLFEDVATRDMLTYPCERIALVGAGLYGYRTRKDGLSNGTPSNVRGQELVYAFQARIDYYKSVNRPDLAQSAEQTMIRWLRKNLENKL